MMPSKRSPVSGSSAETMGVCSVTSRRTCAATIRTMRSASAAPMRSPLSRRPTMARSIHSRPSGLTMTSSTVGSAKAAAILGPKAVRSICRRRASASSAAAVAKTSGILFSCGSNIGGSCGSNIGGLGFLGWVGPARIGGGCELIRLILGEPLHHLRRQAPIAAQPPGDLFNEYVKTLATQRARSLLLALGERRGDGEEVAHVQGQRFADDGALAADAVDALGEKI